MRATDACTFPHETTAGPHGRGDMEREGGASGSAGEECVWGKRRKGRKSEMNGK